MTVAWDDIFTTAECEMIDYYLCRKTMSLQNTKAKSDFLALNHDFCSQARIS